ncbi:unnamed protein product [Urochloa humidicola]
MKAPQRLSSARRRSTTSVWRSWTTAVRRSEIDASTSSGGCGRSADAWEGSNFRSSASLMNWPRNPTSHEQLHFTEWRSL